MKRTVAYISILASILVAFAAAQESIPAQPASSGGSDESYEPSAQPKPDAAGGQKSFPYVHLTTSFGGAVKNTFISVSPDQRYPLLADLYTYALPMSITGDFGYAMTLGDNRLGLALIELAYSGGDPFNQSGGDNYFGESSSGLFYLKYSDVISGIPFLNGPLQLGAKADANFDRSRFSANEDWNKGIYNYLSLGGGLESTLSLVKDNSIYLTVDGHYYLFPNYDSARVLLDQANLTNVNIDRSSENFIYIKPSIMGDYIFRDVVEGIEKITVSASYGLDLKIYPQNPIIIGAESTSNDSTKNRFDQVHAVTLGGALSIGWLDIGLEAGGEFFRSTQNARIIVRRSSTNFAGFFFRDFYSYNQISLTPSLSFNATTGDFSMVFAPSMYARLYQNRPTGDPQGEPNAVLVPGSFEEYVPEKDQAVWMYAYTIYTAVEFKAINNSSKVKIEYMYRNSQANDKYGTAYIYNYELTYLGASYIYEF